MMAAPEVNIRDVDDLSEDQIEQLLQQAEARLRAEHGNNAQQNDKALARLPHLDTSAVTKPYVNTKGDVARADTHRLIDGEARKLAEGIRKIEDPVVMRKKLLEVRSTLLLTIFPHAYEEDNFQLFP